MHAQRVRTGGRHLAKERGCLKNMLTWRGHDIEFIGSRGGKLDVARVTKSYDGWWIYDSAGEIKHGPVPLLSIAQDWAQAHL